MLIVSIEKCIMYLIKLSSLCFLDLPSVLYIFHINNVIFTVKNKIGNEGDEKRENQQT